MTGRRLASIARQVVITAALASGVTVAGVAAGALVIAPVVSAVAGPDSQSSPSLRMPAFSLPAVRLPRMTMPTIWTPALRLPALSQLTSLGARALRSRFAVPVGLTVLSLLALSRLPAVQRRMQRVTARPSLASMSTAPASARSRMRTPVRPDRTPRAVEALAASGTAPSEISWRTGLPLDAVALLLSLSSAQRQLQPPTA